MKGIFVSIGKYFWEKLLVGLIIYEVILHLQLLLRLIVFNHRELDLFHIISMIPSISLLLLSYSALLVLLMRLLLVVTLVCILT